MNMPRTLALRIITVSRVRYIFHFPSAHNYLIDSGYSNVKMFVVSSSINARNRMFERRGIYKIVVDRPKWRPGVKCGR
jgi:hypothetical protein